MIGPGVLQVKSAAGAMPVHGRATWAIWRTLPSNPAQTVRTGARAAQRVRLRRPTVMAWTGVEALQDIREGWHANWSFLEVGNVEEDAMAEIQSILFASDLTPESDHAFEHARFLAERFRTRMTLFHALEMPREPYEGWIDMQDDRRGRWAAKVRQELCQRARTLTVPYEIVVDEAHTGGHALADLAILDIIQKTRPDLTVMATRSRKGFA